MRSMESKTYKYKMTSTMTMCSSSSSKPKRKKRRTQTQTKRIQRSRCIEKILSENKPEDKNSKKIEKLEKFINSYETKNEYERVRYEIAKRSLKRKKRFFQREQEKLINFHILVPIDCMGIVASYIEREKDLLSFVVSCDETAVVTDSVFWEEICKKRVDSLTNAAAATTTRKKKYRRKLLDIGNWFDKKSGERKGKGNIIDLTKDFHEFYQKINYQKKKNKKKKVLVPKEYVELLYKRYDNSWREVLNDIHVYKSSINKMVYRELMIFKELINDELMKQEDLVKTNGELKLGPSTIWAKEKFEQSNIFDKEKKLAKKVKKALDDIRERKIKALDFHITEFEKEIKKARNFIRERLDKKCNDEDCKEVIEDEWKKCESCEREFCVSCWEFSFYCLNCNSEYCTKCSRRFDKWCNNCESKLSIF